MQRLAAVLTAVCLLTGLVVAAAPTAPAATESAQRSIRATVRVVVRPVNARGRRARGFSLRRIGPGHVVFCNDGTSSPVAVDRNIARCSPSISAPPACWRAAFPHRVLCFLNAHDRFVFSIRRAGRFAPTRPPRRPDPLNMRLGNGRYCSIRIGGSVGRLENHPRWVLAYYCHHSLGVWMHRNGRPGGINRTRRVWTVHVAVGSLRHARLIRRRVARVWFVGTRR